jgi:pimeloyl-ACP methyl ester carboxylesterase
MALRSHKPHVAWVITVVAAALLAPATAGAAPTNPVAVQNCHPVRLPVALDPGGARQAQLAGDVCYPSPVPVRQRTIQVLVSGTAYGKTYWDFPYQPHTYSYVRAANAAGFTTFNLDRVGIGSSSRPLSSQITIPSNAYSIHQAIQHLRSGAVDGVRYDRVVLVGHSLGSLISWYEAAEYHDVDAVIASGILHTFDAPGVAKFGVTLYPAALDPRFAGKIIDPGYLTTTPGTRAESFYYLPNADPQVIDTDEAIKETATLFEAADVFEQELPGSLGGARDPLCAVLTNSCEGVTRPRWYGVTPDITVPVLNVVGQYDTLLCGGATRPNRCTDLKKVRQDESAYFRGLAKRCLVLASVPDSGHNLNLHRNASSWFNLSNQWAAFTVGQSAAGSGQTCWHPDADMGTGMRFG